MAIKRGRRWRYGHQLFVKEPGTAAPTPWHNDTSYWHLTGQQVCSVWLALDDVPASRGLSYVKGSHRWNLLHRVTNFSVPPFEKIGTLAANDISPASHPWPFWSLTLDFSSDRAPTTSTQPTSTRAPRACHPYPM